MYVFCAGECRLKDDFEDLPSVRQELSLKLKFPDVERVAIPKILLSLTVLHC